MAVSVPSSKRRSLQGVYAAPGLLVSQPLTLSSGVAARAGTARGAAESLGRRVVGPLGRRAARSQEDKLTALLAAWPSG